LQRSGWSIVGHGLVDHNQQRSSRFSPTVKPEAPRMMLHGLVNVNSNFISADDPQQMWAG